MAMLISYMTTVISFIIYILIPFLFVLGVLVFFHELGHFLVAKKAGIKVERFSLGFPPKMFGFKVGETEYCISWIPFGGYVKLAGMSDIGYEEVHGDPWEFMSKPIWMRMSVIAAGPLMNFLLAILIFFTILCFMGKTIYNTTVISRIDWDSTAQSDGFKSGDQILSVGGKSVENWDDIAEAFQKESAKGTASVEVERGDEILFISVNLEADLGIEPFVSSKIGSVSKDWPAQKMGLESGDVITSVEGEAIKEWSDVSRSIRKRPMEKITLEWIRNGKEMSGTAVSNTKVVYEPDERYININKLVEGTLSSFDEKIKDKEVIITRSLAHMPMIGGDEDRLKGLMSSLVERSLRSISQGGELTIRTEFTESPQNEKEAALAILNVTASKVYAEAMEKIEENRTDRYTIVRENGELEGIVEIERSVQGQVAELTLYQEYGIIGIGPAPDFVYVPIGLLEAAHGSIGRTLLITKFIGANIKKLIVGGASLKELGGPITIARMAGDSARSGLVDLFTFMAVISINLGILNILPIPALDGGHLMFLTFEGIFRRQLSTRQKEVTQQVGVALLLFLMIYVTFNDIVRILE